MKLHANAVPVRRAGSCWSSGLLVENWSVTAAAAAAGRQ